MAMHSFRIFDRNGTGQINTSDMLPVMKKYLKPK